MSRGLIIGILILLIIGIIGGTAALIIQRLLPTDSTSSSPQPTSGLLPGTQEGTRLGTLDPLGDEDGDGLSNGDEQKWGADINNPDTDGDGFKDGEEVRANHNPTIAGPNDTIPEGFVPGQ